MSYEVPPKIIEVFLFSYTQAVQRPWDEDPFAMSEEVMKNISLEIVREKLLDHVHQVNQFCCSINYKEDYNSELMYLTD